MDTLTKKVLTAVALIVATGVTAVEMTRTSAYAQGGFATGTAAYAGERINVAFQVAAEMPPVEPVSLPLAVKGDMLPIGCAGPFRAEEQAECIDAAYELASEPSTVVETRHGSTSILMRLESISTAAGF
jgi:hypothetical protein